MESNCFYQENFSSMLLKFSDFFICEKIFNFLGFSIFKRNVKMWNRINFLLSIVFVGILMILCIFSIIISYGSLNFFAIVENCILFTGSSIIWLKWFPLAFSHNHKIENLIKSLLKYFPCNAFDQQNYRAEKYLKTIRMFFYINSMFISLTMISIILAPLIEQAYGYINEISIYLKPIFNLYYPFDSLKHGTYEIVFIVFAWYFTMNFLVLISTDNLFTSLCMLICMGLHNLADSFAEINMKNEKEAIDQMKKLIKRHQEYLEIIRDFEVIFSIPLFINMIGIIGLICMTAFLATVSYQIYFAPIYS